MPDERDEIVLQFFSRTPWDAPQLWERTLVILGDVLNGMPLKLDANDPLKRNFKDYSLNENAVYICDFGLKETSRTIFGRYPKKKCYFSSVICKASSGNNNALSIYLPNSAIETAESLFNRLLEVLSPIYAYADFQTNISKKKRADFFAVNLEEELVGVFWLTFFCSTYVNHFGASKFTLLNNIGLVTSSHGIVAKLADSPESAGINLRQSVEEAIGKLSFVDPQSILHKPIGEYVPSYDKF